MELEVRLIEFLIKKSILSKHQTIKISRSKTSHFPFQKFYLAGIPVAVAVFGVGVGDFFIVPDLVATGLALAEAVGLGVSIGLGLSTIVLDAGVGLGIIAVAEYLPLNQTK